MSKWPNEKNFFSSLLSTVVTSLAAQTYISNAITSNATWTVANSPYIVTTDVALFPNITLIIEPGVTVKFDDNASLDLQGNLRANGTATDSITFTSSSASPFEGIWDGLQIENGQGGKANFKYCRAFYAEGFITMKNGGPSDTVVTLKNCRISYNYWGVNNQDGIPTYIITIDSCKFEYNKAEGIVFGNYMTVSNCIFKHDVLYSDRSNPICSNCVFDGNSNVSGSFTVCFAGTITGCTIINNDEGIRAWSTTHATNNFISNNKVGINLVSPVPAGYITNNTICNNTTFNIQSSNYGNSDLSHNCWCSTDSAAIAPSINDAFDNGTLGIVYFMPLDTVCSPVAIESISSPSNALSVFPNPFNTTTNIQFAEDISSLTTLKIYDLNGRPVKNLLDNKLLQSGHHSINIDGNGLDAGVYLIVLERSSQTECRKLILMK